MPVLSQERLSGTIAKGSVTVYPEHVAIDRDATIAIGNLLSRGRHYSELFEMQSMLVDSLYVEISLKDLIIKDQGVLISSLRETSREKDVLAGFVETQHSATISSMKKDLARQRWHFLLLGSAIGILLGLFSL